MLAGFAVQALDLPIKTVNGRMVYFYKVEKKESVYGIAKRLHLSREEIVRHNPAVDDGVKKGMELYFPVSEYAQIDSDELRDKADGINGDGPELAADTVPEQAMMQKEPTIALLLPFGLDKAELSRTNELALDFYKGFMIGADTLARRSGHVNIAAFDTESPSLPLDSIMRRHEVASAAIIVAPNNQQDLAAIAADALAAQTRVFNVFTVHDSLYLTNPMVVQANIPQKQMYKLAADAFITRYGAYTPVILRNSAGKNDKEAFVAYLTERLAERGVVPQVMEYENNLTMANLETLPVGAGEKYVMLPCSGSLAEFNKFAHTLKMFRDRISMVDTEAEDYDPTAPLPQVALFGYPDWTAFRGEALDMLHKLGVTVYSRFFDNFSGFEARNLENDFRYWYGSEIIESVPSQATLGFDTACYLIKNLRANNGVYDPEFPQFFEGVQSAFEFEKTGEGYTNATLYILEYQPDGRISEQTI